MSLTHDLALPIEKQAVLQMPTDELRKRLAEAIGLTARTLSYLAVVWAELERRGDDLSDLRGGLMTYLPLIAAGRLDPELVVRCAGQATLLKLASEAPMEDQRRLLAQGARIVEIDGDAITERAVPVEALTVAQVRRVFASDGLRSPADQARMLGIRPSREAQRRVRVALSLTKPEYEALRVRARKAGRQVQTFVRDLVLTENQDNEQRRLELTS